jgi:predicted Zn-dependent protease
VDKQMAKLTPEQLKQIRINNLSKGRMGKGRPKGVKNKITAKKVNEMIIKFLDQQENKNISKSDIINQELKIDLNDESIKHPQLELEIKEDVKDKSNVWDLDEHKEVKEKVERIEKEIIKKNQLQQDNKEVQKEVEKIDKQEKSEEKPKPYRLFDF